MASKKPKPEPDRLKIEGSWEDAAARLLNAPAKSTPPREVKSRKKAAQNRKSKKSG